MNRPSVFLCRYALYQILYMFAGLHQHWLEIDRSEQEPSDGKVTSPFVKV